MQFEIVYPSGERARWVGPNEGLFDSMGAAVMSAAEHSRSVGEGGLVVIDRFRPSLRITVTNYAR